MKMQRYARLKYNVKSTGGSVTKRHKMGMEKIQVKRTSFAKLGYWVNDGNARDPFKRDHVKPNTCLSTTSNSFIH
jgi:hypothetical protein